MIPAIDLSSLSAPAQKIAGPTAPAKLQEMAARGIAPGIRPAELVALLVLLSTSELPAVHETAKKTLAALPEPVLTGSLTGDLPPAAIDVLARHYIDRHEVVQKLLMMPRISMETVEDLARDGVEGVTELIATNEERLLHHPRIIELLYMNRRTRMSTADRLVDLAIRHGLQLTGISAFKEVAAAIQDELIPEPTEERTPDDELFFEAQALAEELAIAPDEDAFDEVDDGGEVVKDKLQPLYKRIADMTMSQKVRRAILGSKEERMLFIRDQNKIVSGAAARSPLMQESDILLITKNRNISDEVLRIIATSPVWLKSYMVKKNLIENPKTPIALASKLVQHMRESDLRGIAKSKNVTGAIQDAARRHLERKKS